MAAPGLELMFNSIKNDISSSQDSIVSVLHWQIVAGGYKCIGNGEKAGQNDEESEMLPDGWNSTPALYVLRYKHSSTGHVFVFKVITVDNTLLAHFWKASEEKVAVCNIRVGDFATEDFSSYKKNSIHYESFVMRTVQMCLGDHLVMSILESTVVPWLVSTDILVFRALKKVDKLCQLFSREVLNEVQPSSQQASTSRQGQRSSQDTDDDPLRVPPRQRPRPRGDPDDPFSVERADLDPFGTGGGMLFDPLRGGRGPRFGMDPSAGLPSRLPRGDPDDPFSVGRADLDPFGAGGGMLFDPLRGGRGPRFGMDPSAGLPSRLPRGAVPPGARFDPFGPPGTHPGSRSGPDPDHMRPPDYDDMFM